MSSRSERRTPRRRLLKWALGILAAFVIVVAVGVGLFRVAANEVPRYHDRIVQQVSKELGAPVQLGRISLRWHLFGPELVVRNVHVLSSSIRTPVISVRRLRLDFSLLSMLKGMKARPSGIHLRDVRLVLVRQPDGSIDIPGLSFRKRQGVPGGGGLLAAALSVHNADVRLHFGSAGAATWRFFPVDIDIAGGRRHSVNVSVHLPEQLGGGTLRATGSVHVPSAAPAAWDWEAHIALDRLQLAPLQRFMPHGMPEIAGRLALDGRLAGKGVRPSSGNGRLSVSSLVSGTSRIQGFQTRFKLTASNGYALALSDTRLIEGGHVQAPGAIGLARSAEGRYSVSVERLQLGWLSHLTGFLPTGATALAARLRDVKPTGTVHGLQLAFTPGKPDVDLKAGLRDISVAAADNAPGFRHLSGTAHITRGVGTIVLDAPGFTMLMPHLFGHPVRLARIGGTLDVALTGQGLTLGTPQLSIAAPGLNGQLEGEIAVPRKGPVRIKLAAVAGATDLVQARAHYLPHGLLPRPLDKWLMKSLQRGQITRAQLSIDGTAKQFPYLHGGGEFQTRFGFSGVTLTPGPGWVPLRELQGHVTFHNAALHAEITGGEISGAKVRHATTAIPNLFKLQLAVDADVAGNASDFLAFLRASPAGVAVKQGFAGLHADGPTVTLVHLRLPIMHPQRFTLHGELKLSGVKASYTGAPVTLQKLSGSAAYDRKGPLTGRLKGWLLGTPVTLLLARNAQTGSAQIRMRGTFPVATLSRGLRLHLDRYAAGHLPLEVDLSVPVTGKGHGVVVDARSDLRGLALKVPAPVGKPADTPLPAAVHVVVQGTQLKTEASIGKVLRGCADVQVGKAQPVIRGLHVVLGDGGCRVSSPGVLVTGGWPKLMLGPWLSEFAGQGGQAPSAEKLGPLKIDLKFGVVHGFSQAFRDQRIVGRLTPAQMSLQLSGPALEGKLNIPRKPTNEKPILVELTRARLQLPQKQGVVAVPASKTAGAPASAAGPASATAAKTGAVAQATSVGPGVHAGALAPGVATSGSAASTGKPINPQDIPPFVVHAAHMELGSAALDDVLIKGRRVPDGTLLDPVHVGGGALKLDGTLVWIKPADGSTQGSLHMVANVDGLGALFSGLGLGPVMTGHGAISASLAWHEAPGTGSHFANELLGGVSVDLRDGSIAQVNPGAGRLLSLLALANVPRYLVFNFNNLFGKGFPFSRIHGDYSIDKGIAHTKGLIIDSSVAWIKLMGSVNLAQQTIDQTAEIVPNYTGSLPIIGALLGGLPVGAAIFAVTKIFGGAIAQATKLEYTVRGPLNNPQVKPVGSASPIAVPRKGTAGVPAPATTGGGR